MKQSLDRGLKGHLGRGSSTERTPRTAAALPGRRRPRFGQLASHAVLIIMTVGVLLPFFWMALGSLKTYDDLLNSAWTLPNPWTLDNYAEIFSQTNFSVAFLNSVIMAGARVVLVCVTSVAVGYVFAKYRFPGRDFLFLALLATMMVPFAAVLVPLYLTLGDLHLLNGRNGLIGLIAVGAYSAFGIFLLRQFIRDIPDSFIDAARIDGASELWVLRRIIVPLSRAPLAALAIFTFLWSWDDFLFPSIVLSDPSVRTLPLALAGLKSLYWERYELYSAGAMVTVVPVMILYLFMQRHFVRGLTMGGVKD